MGELPPPAAPLEAVQEFITDWKAGDTYHQLFAALAYEGLAFASSDRKQSESFIDQAAELLEAVDTRENRRVKPRQTGTSKRVTKPLNTADSYPTYEGVMAQAYLNLLPLVGTLAVEKRLVEMPVVEQANRRFLADVGSQLARAERLFNDGRPKTDALKLQKGMLVAGFNILALQGLFMRFQLSEIQANDWMALPAFIDPAMITSATSLDAPPPAAPDRVISEGGELAKWDISVFTQPRNQPPDLTYKIFVRTSPASPHLSQQDDDTSVIWIWPDLALPDEPMTKVSSITILKELGKTAGTRTKTARRIGQLLDVMEQRTFADVRQLLQRLPPDDNPV